MASIEPLGPKVVPKSGSAMLALQRELKGSLDIDIEIDLSLPKSTSTSVI